MKLFTAKRIMPFLALTAFFCSLHSLQAQKAPQASEVMMTDLGGKAIYLKTEYVFEGSPYLPEEYTNATVVLKNGKTYTNVRSKMNFNDNSLLMLQDDGTVLKATSSILHKVIYESVPSGDKFRTVVFQNGFKPIDGLDSTTYYQVLDSGKLTLLKYCKSTYADRKGYGEANMTRVFTTKESYYVALPGNILKPLEKGKDEFLSLLPSKKVEMEKYIDSKKIKCKKEEDWVYLVSYYNGLEN